MYVFRLVMSVTPSQRNVPTRFSALTGFIPAGRLDQRCDAQRPEDTFHAVRVCNWGATEKSRDGLKIWAFDQKIARIYVTTLSSRVEARQVPSTCLGPFRHVELVA